MTTADILATYAPAAGLSPSIRPSTFGKWLHEQAAGPKRHPVPYASARQAPPPFLQAPMAGVSDAAYRIMMRSGGAALAYTEMVSVNGLHYGSDKTWELVLPDAAEPDVAIQLFGADPLLFGEASSAVTSRLGERLALIDINMACPVPKVVRGGAGSALLDDANTAAAIVAACAEATHVPVTVKIRAGRREGEEVAPAFARSMVAAGASAVAVHGRTATQMYCGQADWNVVRHVAEAVEVPVIGSGDVRDAATAAAMPRATGVSAVMVARGGYGMPWIFADAKRIVEGQPINHTTFARRLAALEMHVRLLDATGAHMARARSLYGWYLRGIPHAAQWRDEAMRCVTLDDYLHLLWRLRIYADERDR